MLSTLSMLKISAWRFANSVDTGFAHEMLGFLGFLSTCSNAEPCVILLAFLVPVDWSAPSRFLGPLSCSPLLAPDWARVAASARAVTLAFGGAGGRVGSTVLTLDWASAAVCCRATSPDWAGGRWTMVPVDAVSLLDTPSVLLSWCHESGGSPAGFSTLVGSGSGGHFLPLSMGSDFCGLIKL